MLGNASQAVYAGLSGSAITAVPDAGYYFVDWSDSSTANPRTDVSVTADVTLMANFEDNAVFYANWESTYNVTGGLLGDADGVSNLLEYALGGRPNQSDAATVLPVGQIIDDAGTNYLEYIYTRRTDAAARGLTYTLLPAPDLLFGWPDTVSLLSVGPIEPIDPDFESVTSRVPVGAQQQFLKLQVKKAP